jgi:hypothetical protein
VGGLIVWDVERVHRIEIREHVTLRVGDRLELNMQSGHRIFIVVNSFSTLRIPRLLRVSLGFTEILFL